MKKEDKKLDIDESTFLYASLAHRIAKKACDDNSLRENFYNRLCREIFDKCMEFENNQDRPFC